MEGGKWRVEKLQNEERTFNFDLFIYLFFASHLSKPLKFFFGLPKWKFSTGKKRFRRDFFFPVTPQGMTGPSEGPVAWGGGARC